MTTLSPGDRVVARGLPRKPKGSADRLPPTIAIVVKVDGATVRIRLRIGGGAPIKYAPKWRECSPAHVVRLATPREVVLGLVVDPLPEVAEQIR